MTKFASPHKKLEAIFDEASLYDDVDDSVNLTLDGNDAGHVQILRGSVYGGRTMYIGGLWLTESTMWTADERKTYAEAAADVVNKLIELGRL